MQAWHDEVPFIFNTDPAGSITFHSSGDMHVAVKKVASLGNVSRY